MSDFSRSGDFGEVRFFEASVPSGRFHSLDRISVSGWHKVNALYGQERKNGLPFGILLFTVSGEGKISVGGKDFITRQGEVVLIPKNHAHTYRGVAHGLWEFYWLHYMGEHADLLARDILMSGEFHFDVGEKRLRLLMEDYFEKSEKGVKKEISDSEFLDGVLTLLLKRSVETAEDEKMEQMLHFLEEENDFSLEALAEKFHYSKEYLIRMFQKNLGVSPYRYQLMLRLKRSCEALKMSNKTIEEIAADCGYRTVGSYSSQFKKKFGMTPSEYRAFFKNIQN